MTARRAEYFRDLDKGRWLVEKLVAGAARANFAVHAYTVMPDHVHALAEGLAEECDLAQFVEAFKQTTGFEFKRRYEKALWQRRYFDYVLRRADAIEDVASYIWWNPVRKGLCGAPGEYELSGSLTIGWMKRCETERESKPGEGAKEWKPKWKLGQKMPG